MNNEKQKKPEKLTEWDFDIPKDNRFHDPFAWLDWQDKREKYLQPWIGVDFDKTLVIYDDWKGATTFGALIQPMVDKVKELLAQGECVKIFTARAYPFAVDPKGYYSDHNSRWAESQLAVQAIMRWSEDVFGQKLEVTCVKDFGMTSLFDDRAISVIPNKGILLIDIVGELQKELDECKSKKNS